MRDLIIRTAVLVDAVRGMFLRSAAKKRAEAAGDAGSALTALAQGGQVDMVRRLVEAGADVNAENEYGFTALRLAVLEGHADVAKVLREAGARE